MNPMYSNADGQLRSNSFGSSIVNGNVNDTWLCRFSPTPMSQISQLHVTQDRNR